MEDQEDFCRVCLQIQSNIRTVFHYHDKKYLPSVIYNISGVKISARHEPEAKVCSSCSAAIFEAERIILKCQEAEEFLLSRRKTEKKQNIAEPMRYKRKIDGRIQTKFQVTSSKSGREISNESGTNIPELSDAESNSTSPINSASSFISDSYHSFETQDQSNQSGEIEFVSSTKSSYSHQATDFVTAYSNSCVTLPHIEKPRPVAEIKPKLKEIQNSAEENVKNKYEKQQQYMHKCEFCQFETVVRKFYINHLLVDHDIDDTYIYSCSLCPQKFSWRRLLFRHLEEDHKQHPAEKKFMCDECGKAYTHEMYLVNHRKTQHEEENHNCPFPGCDSKFNRIFSLRRHFNNMHSTLKRYYCCTCDKHFSIWDSWKYHMDVVHQNTKITCPKCFSPFRNQKHLQKHMHADGCKNWMFHCMYCKRRFPTQTGWKVHEKSMHLQEIQLGKKPLNEI